LKSIENGERSQCKNIQRLGKTEPGPSKEAGNARERKKMGSELGNTPVELIGH